MVIFNFSDVLPSIVCCQAQCAKQHTSYIIIARLTGTITMACRKEKALHLILWCSVMFVKAANRPLALIASTHAQVVRRAPTAAFPRLFGGRPGAAPLIRVPSAFACYSWRSLVPRKSFQFSIPFSSGSSQTELNGDSDDESGADDEQLTAEESDTVKTYQPGIPKGFFIVDHVDTPAEGFDMDAVERILGASEIDRSQLTAQNVTLPVALMLLDPETYPSLSRARKTCRKGYVLVHRGPLSDQDVFISEMCIRGRVGDRVFAGDVIAQQVRMGNGWYNAQYHEKPPFDLPIVYEDDHFAIINKPAGIVTYSHRSAGHGRMSVKAALPFYVKAPSPGTFSIISRPIACHRLDKPTSGLVSMACAVALVPVATISHVSLVGGCKDKASHGALDETVCGTQGEENLHCDREWNSK